MKKYFAYLGVFVLLVGLAGCISRQGGLDNNNSSEVVANGEVLVVDEEGNSSFSQDQLSQALDGLTVSELRQPEIDGLIQMREEEKLARDVYDELFSMWGKNIFSNIAGSEQTHTDAVKDLLDRYNITDPNEGLSPGEYQNEELQKLYDELVGLGRGSELEALQVGAIVEDLDIFDLQRLLNQTDREDIILVYENLMRGSRNHLRSFVKNINNAGGEYIPQYISPVDYEDIINSEIERGGGNQGRGK